MNLPASPQLRAWLQAGGSLTGRLRRHGVVQVQLLSQGSRRLWPREQQDLACAAGHVREVLLLLDGRPAVWARSAVPHAALAGPWRAMLHLGTRPLADILFGTPSVSRSALQAHALLPHSPQWLRMRAAWARWQCSQAPGSPASSSLWPALPRWGRSSVFFRSGQPLRVFEAFFPRMQYLPAN